MNKELIEAVKLLEKERGLEAGILFDAIEEALVSAYKREFDARSVENIRAEIDRETGQMHVFATKEVVDDVLDPNSELSLEEAKTLSEDFELGDLLEYELSPQDFGRLAAQTAKSVITQKLAGAESERIHKEFSDRTGEICTGIVQRKDRREVIVDIGRAEAVLTPQEQVRGEYYNFNQRMKFYILKVEDRRSRPVVFVSRSHPNLVRKLFEQEVPEIADGTVEIVSLARDAGARSKMAVASRDENVDALGACVGQRGMRVQAVMNELGNEKIDIIEWDPILENYISNALSPAKVVNVLVNEEENMAVVVVPDHQLSLAIGSEGQNARLAARLTGWRIDIKSESQFRELQEDDLIRRVTVAADNLSDQFPEHSITEDEAFDSYYEEDDFAAEHDEVENGDVSDQDGFVADKTWDDSDEPVEQENLMDEAEIPADVAQDNDSLLSEEDAESED